jgi:hypothetical protein
MLFFLPFPIDCLQMFANAFNQKNMATIKILLDKRRHSALKGKSILEFNQINNMKSAA